MTPKRLFRSALVLLAAGIAALVVGQGMTANVIATMLLGVGVVLLVSLFFLMVGESEDRARRDEQAEPKP